jgi:ABC-type thiamin/hydroxymethylpyrimidine transport system permease subunit
MFVQVKCRKKKWKLKKYLVKYLSIYFARMFVVWIQVMVRCRMSQRGVGEQGAVLKNPTWF